MVYSFQEDMCEVEQSGEYEFLFHYIDGGRGDKTRTVEADSAQEAYRNLHYDVGDEWNEWVCLGRKDILEYKIDVHEYDSVLDARCSTTGLHPVDFASTNESTVERWEKEDE